MDPETLRQIRGGWAIFSNIVGVSLEVLEKITTSGALQIGSKGQTPLLGSNDSEARAAETARANFTSRVLSAVEAFHKPRS